MGCILKLPTKYSKGVLSLTTAEQGAIADNPGYLALYNKVRQKYVTCLHYNHFHMKPRLDFDIHLAGSTDLHHSVVGKVRTINLTACSFVNECFYPNPKSEKHWDILCIARAVDYKGTPDFFDAMKTCYANGLNARVLMLTPVQNDEAEQIKREFNSRITNEQQKYFNLLLLRERFPFFFDRETLAFFYRSSKILVQASPAEVRGRAATYAWSSGIPVVAKINIAEGLPQEFRKPPYFYEVDKQHSFADRITQAIRSASESSGFEDQDLIDHFSSRKSKPILETELKKYFAELGMTWEGRVNFHELDIRLARHHGFGNNENLLNQTIGSFMDACLSIEQDRAPQYLDCLDPEQNMLRAINTDTLNCNQSLNAKPWQKLKSSMYNITKSMGLT